MNFEKFECALSYALQRIGAPKTKHKPEQVLAIQLVYDRRDVFVWLPYGFGKSFCYEALLPFFADWKRAEWTASQPAQATHENLTTKLRACANSAYQALFGLVARLHVPTALLVAAVGLWLQRRACTNCSVVNLISG